MSQKIWEIDILYWLVRKTKFALILHVRSIPNNYDEVLFEGVICKEYGSIQVRSSIKAFKKMWILP